MRNMSLDTELVEVRSNSLRNQAIMVSDFRVFFNETGVAFVPPYMVPEFEKLDAKRPNRFWFPNKKPKTVTLEPAGTKKLEEPKEEAEVALKELPEEKPEAEKTKKVTRSRGRPKKSPARKNTSNN